MRKIFTILFSAFALLSNAQCPTSPDFSIQRESGNTFMFINTTPQLDSQYTSVYTWTFGDMHYIINPSSDTVFHTYNVANDFPQDTLSEYRVMLGVEIYKNGSGVCNPYKVDTIQGISNVSSIYSLANMLKIYVYNKNLIINYNTEINYIKIFNTIGQIVFEKNLNISDVNIQLPQILNGIYVISISDINNLIFNKTILITN